MPKYYRIDLKNKNNEIIYPNVHPKWTFGTTDGDLTISKGSMLFSNGSVRLANGNLTLDKGEFILEDGIIMITKGNINLAQGDINVNNGNIYINKPNCYLKIKTTPTDDRYMLIGGNGGITFVAPNGGWANDMRFLKGDGTTVFGAIGAYGSADNLNFFYMGSDYSNSNFRVYLDGTIILNKKRAIVSNDTWLRINENSAFTEGVYFGTSIIRTDKGIQVGSSGSIFQVTSNGTVQTSRCFAIPCNSLNGYGIVNSKGKSILKDWNNSSVTIDATGKDLHLGHENTEAILACVDLIPGDRGDSVHLGTFSRKFNFSYIKHLEFVGGSYSWFSAAGGGTYKYTTGIAYLEQQTYSGWQPIFSGVNQDGAIWQFGMYTGYFQLNRIAKGTTSNSVSQSWTFNTDGSISMIGGKVTTSDDWSARRFRAGALSTWNSNYGSYAVGTVMFCW